MAMVLVAPIVDLFIRSSPMRIHSPAWRLGVMSTAAGTVVTPLLALFVIFVIAVAAEDRGVAYFVSVCSLFTAFVCILATGIFALDALQMKGQVASSLMEGYGVGTTWVVIRLLMCAAVSLVLGVSAFRAASGRRAPSAPVSKASSMLVGTAGRPAAGAAKHDPGTVEAS